MGTEERLDVIGRSAYSTKETLRSTYNLACDLIERGVEGDFVECGVAAGAQIGAMGLAMQDLGDRGRMIIGFDSFEGIPLAGKMDTQQPGIGDIKHDVNVSERELLKTSGITSHSLENVWYNLDCWDLPLSKYEFIKGWFQDTIPPVVDKYSKIAMLRLDGDLYESTKYALMLEKNIVSGGVLIIDDWALVGCRRACDEFIDYSQYMEMQTVPNSTPVYFVKK